MPTAVKKARRASGIPYTKPQKTPTGPYRTKKERYEDRREDRRAASVSAGVMAGVSAALRRARGAIRQ